MAGHVPDARTAVQALALPRHVFNQSMQARERRRSLGFVEISVLFMLKVKRIIKS